MVPAAYVPVRRTPSNANGKLDRTKLHRLASHELTDEQWRQYSLANVTKRLPSTTMEKKLKSSAQLPILLGSMTFFQAWRRFHHSNPACEGCLIRRHQPQYSRYFPAPCLGSLACLAIPTSPNRTTAATEYKPFSLLDTPDTLALLEKNIFTNPLFEKDNVLDVMPTTDFQSMAITGT